LASAGGGGPVNLVLLAVAKSPVHDDLWFQIDAALNLWPSRDKTFAQLNRLLAKRFPDLPPSYFTQVNCAVRLERLTASELAKFNPGHSRTEPRRMTGPIIASEFRGNSYILDGTNRLNVWVRDGDVELHDTIIVKNIEQ